MEFARRIARPFRKAKIAEDDYERGRLKIRRGAANDITAEKVFQPVAFDHQLTFLAYNLGAMRLKFAELGGALSIRSSRKESGRDGRETSSSD